MAGCWPALRWSFARWVAMDRCRRRAAWRPKSPPAAELRGLAPAIAEALRLM
jgi:hypothetical protein